MLIFMEHLLLNTCEVRIIWKIKKQNDLIIAERFFKQKKTPIKKKREKVSNPKTMKQIATDKINLDHKKLDEKLAKGMINPY